MKIVFMGTPDFSVPTLDALVDNGHELLAVVTQPDKPKGRGKAIQMTPVKERAIELGIAVYQPQKVKDHSFVSILKELNPDVIVVVAFGQLLSKEILMLPRYGCINIHASLLPKYRGAAPIQWTIIDGETETGVTTMMMDVGLDTGDMLEKAIVKIEKDETGGSLHDKLSQAGGQLIITTLKGLEEHLLQPVPQVDADSCYAKMLDKSLGDIDWNCDAEAIERLIRGLNPWPSAYTMWEGKTLKIWQAEVVDREADGSFGEVVQISKSALYVKTGRKLLSLHSVQLEGKRRMDISEFMRGNSIQTGMVFQRKMPFC